MKASTIVTLALVGSGASYVGYRAVRPSPDDAALAGDEYADGPAGTRPSGGGGSTYVHTGSRYRRSYTGSSYSSRSSSYTGGGSGSGGGGGSGKSSNGSGTSRGGFGSTGHASSSGS